MTITTTTGAILANLAARGNIKALRDLLLDYVSMFGSLAAGTVTASQAVVVSATKTITGFLSVAATTFIGNIRITVNADVAAAGSALADAAQLLEGFQVVTGADGTKGVKLPATPTAGTLVWIKGTTAAVLKVWPDAAATINAIGSNGALSLTTGVMPSMFIAKSATQWYSFPLVAS